MTSDVDICNLALLRLGTRSSISSFTEGSVEANACSQIYALVRDMLLASHNWGFATRRIGLADLGTPLPPWGYRYAYPIDCLRVRAVLPTDGTSAPSPFEVSGDQDQQGNSIKIILSNQDQAELLYTARVTSPDLFSPHFVEALSWMIAAELSTALCSDNTLSQYALQMAAQSIASSKANDANESPSKQDHLCEWVSVRGFAHADTSWRNRT